MTTHCTSLALLLALVATACGEASPPAEAPTSAATAEAAPLAPAADPAAIAEATATGVLARNILGDVTRAESLLGDAHLTAESFEARLYDIAADPARTDAYRAALEAP